MESPYAYVRTMRHFRYITDTMTTLLETPDVSSSTNLLRVCGERNTVFSSPLFLLKTFWKTQTSY